MTAPAASQEEKKDATPPPAPASGHVAVAQQVLKRADTAAKSLGSVGTAVITAIGIVKFSDIWPHAGDTPSVRAIAATILGFLCMAAVVWGFTYRLWGLNEPILWRPDIDEIDGLRKRERELVRPVYQKMADLNEVQTLRAYEKRALRFERIAVRLPKRISDRVSADANTIKTEISAIHARANLRVVYARANLALRGKGAVFLAILFLVGVVMFGLGADYLQSERADAIATAKACAEASEAGAKDLPTICRENEKEEEEPEPTTRQEIATAVEQLGVAINKCEVAAEKAGEPSSECAPLRNSLDSLLAEL